MWKQFCVCPKCILEGWVCAFNVFLTLFVIIIYYLMLAEKQLRADIVFAYWFMARCYIE